MFPFSWPTGYKPVDVGWLSLLPPILTMILAIATKEVVISLLLGTLLASVIYVVKVHGSVMEVAEVLFQMLFSRVSANMSICIFTFLMGALVSLIAKSGGTNAFGAWSDRFIHGRRGAMLVAFFSGLSLFLDDYFNIITNSAICKVILDRNRVSRPKLAFLIHTMASNICILAPISSWSAVIIAQIEECGIAESFSIFLKSICLNLYPMLYFVFIFLTTLFDVNIGSMSTYEENAINGTSDGDGSKIESKREETPNPKGTVWDLLLPILTCIVFSVLFMIYLGGGFSGKKSLREIFADTDTGASLSCGAFMALLVCFLLYVPRQLLSRAVFMEEMLEGMKGMIDTLIILVLAWTIGGVGGTLLQTGEYVGTLIARSSMPLWVVPTVVFLVGAVLTASLGTAWAGFSVLIPIVISICRKTDIGLVVPCISACLCGSVFGDNISPICDNTILTSMTTQCNFMVHVKTETVYAVVMALLSLVGYVIVGITKNTLLTLLVPFGLELVLVVCIVVMKRMRFCAEKAQEGDVEKALLRDEERSVVRSVQTVQTAQTAQTAQPSMQSMPSAQFTQPTPLTQSTQSTPSSQPTQPTPSTLPQSSSPMKAAQ